MARAQNNAKGSEPRQAGHNGAAAVAPLPVQIKCCFATSAAVIGKKNKNDNREEEVATRPPRPPAKWPSPTGRPDLDQTAGPSYSWLAIYFSTHSASAGTGGASVIIVAASGASDRPLTGPTHGRLVISLIAKWRRRDLATTGPVQLPSSRAAR